MPTKYSRQVHGFSPEVAGLKRGFGDWISNVLKLPYKAREAVEKERERFMKEGKGEEFESRLEQIFDEMARREAEYPGYRRVKEVRLPLPDHADDKKLHSGFIMAILANGTKITIDIDNHDGRFERKKDEITPMPEVRYQTGQQILQGAADFEVIAVGEEFHFTYLDKGELRHKETAKPIAIIYHEVTEPKEPLREVLKGVSMPRRILTHYLTRKRKT